MVGQQYEAKFVNEYLANKYFGEHYDVRQWLGLPPEKEFREMYGVTSRWADAIVFGEQVITIIEAKLKPTPDGVGQLLEYADLFTRTPRFSQYKDRQIKLVYLTTKVDADLQATCEDHNIEYVVFRPKWIEAWEFSAYRFEARV